MLLFTQHVYYFQLSTLVLVSEPFVSVEPNGHANSYSVAYCSSVLLGKIYSLYCNDNGDYSVLVILIVIMIVIVSNSIIISSNGLL